ncbi:MAG: GTP cyclohydrolase II, partial [Betaproteobacteria bacterium]|nr:GTP cyclohydrolase II [Betaproteobacteria bacterium]
DLARLAGCQSAGVICEIMNEDGSMARMPDLKKFSEEHRLPIVTIADLISYRMRHETLVRKAEEAELPTEYGNFRLFAFENDVDEMTHVALVMGEIRPEVPTLVRVHSQCLTGDTFASKRCDCGLQMHRSLQKIAAEGTGVFLYIRQEGRGIGLFNKIRAYALQDRGHDTVEANHALGFAADMRDYKAGAHILFDLGVRAVRLMTNNPEKVAALEEYGLTVAERVAVEIPPRSANREYLRTKRTKFGHLLSMVGQGEKPR